MRHLHCRLVNPPTQDPSVFVHFLFLNRGLLFDIGNIEALSNREVLKITDVFVSHTHMDHFYGFDRLLRVCLGRNKTIRMYGPEGFLKHVEGKLAGYSWDLVANYPMPFRIEATEVRTNGVWKQTFRCIDGFRPEREPDFLSEINPIRSEPRFEVSCAILDHGIPCLGFALQERFHVHILEEGLRRLGLKPGRWLVDFKDALYRDPETQEEFQIVDPDDPNRSRMFRMDRLRREIAAISQGIRVAYVTDVRYCPENEQKILTLAHHADRLFIEAAFLDQDAALAERKHHLTARQAGELAGRAGARSLCIFHFSPRYAGRGMDLEREAKEAYEHALFTFENTP